MQRQLPVAGEVTEAGVDWITATAQEPTARRWFEAHGPLIVQREVARGNTAQAWRWEGYSGQHAGQCSFGIRPDGAIIRLSGSGAAQAWRGVAEHAGTISRLDLAVTVRGDGTLHELATRAYSDATRTARARGKELSCSLIVSSDGGATAYLGSRSSDKFGRLYDKGVETDEERYRGCWRYEVEYKRMPAGRLARWLLGQADELVAVRQVVGQHWLDRGVTPLFPLSGRLDVPSSEGRRTDDERRLLWLNDQVRLVVLPLIERRGRAVVMQALGLINDPRESVN